MDATDKMKPETHREWGKVMYMEDDVINKVSNMWAEMGLDKNTKPLFGKNNTSIKTHIFLH